MVEVLVGHSTNRIKHGRHELLDVFYLVRIAIKLGEMIFDTRGENLLFEYVSFVEEDYNYYLPKATIVDNSLKYIHTFY